MKLVRLSFLLALAVLARDAVGSPPGTVSRRGDFFYSATGELAGSVHRDLPASFERRPMSHKEQFEVLGLTLPERPMVMLSRRPHAKPAQLLLHKGLHQNRIEFKIVEGIAARLRDEQLTSAEADLRGIMAILAEYPEAKLTRLHSVDERILDENKEAGERISGRMLPDLNNWYYVELPEASERGPDLARRLLALPMVETAYLQERSYPTACADVTPVTPLYEASQNYLNPAPDGVDAEYAWTYHAGGNGAGTGFWVVDCEWEWCLTHEDLDFVAADVINGNTESTDPDFNDNHGTAVLGEYGACDNSYGMTGIASDVTLKAADRNSETSWGANITTADAALITGEVMLLEVHIVGPVTGQVCPCNCDQFELVPVEWNQAAFDAIDVATASGVVVVEAAGNGSMDLDNAIYGDLFDRTTRDSRAIMVGAGSNNEHTPMCYTNFGSRVDVHAYGEGVYSTGYGGLYNQTGCTQDYTSSFSGTSSASPIITGVCIALQGIANAKYGYDLSPLQMRNRILVGATPQAASAKNIGPMPDLFDAINGIEPDVAEDFRAGWTGPIVGRTTNDATGADAVIEAAAFPGNVSGPYWSWTTQNYSSYSPTVNEPNTRLTFDDTILSDCNHPNFAVLESRYCANVDQVSVVKGGRHTMRMIADISDVEDESSESNNDYVRQFIWTGLALALDTPVNRTDDPPAVTTGYSWYNAEGFSGATGANFFHAFAVMPHNAGDDVDVRLNLEVPANNPTAGFGAGVALSSDPAGATDFVLVDKYEEPAGTYYASVINHSGTGNRQVEWDMDEGLVANPGTTGAFTIQSGDILELHQVSLSAAAGEYRIMVDVTSGTADIGVSVYPTTGTDGFWGKNEVEPGGYADNVAGTGDEFCIVDPATSGVYAIVVWKVGSSERLESVTYNIVISQVPNLVLDTPAGWYGPLVPRNTTDATLASAPLPGTLTGNATTTSYNFSTFNEGPNAVPGTPSWATRLHVDDVSYWVGTRGSDLASGEFGQWINTSQGLTPFSLVRGGRHYLKTVTDTDLEVTEFNEADNTFVEWFVWTPLALANQVPLTRGAPPEPTPLNYDFYAVDGFRMTPIPAGQPFWSAVGIIPATLAEDYDIRAYDASTGSKSGFGANYAWSSDGPGRSDFSIINYHATARSVRDFGVFKQFAGTGDFVVQRADGYLAGTVALSNGAGPFLGPFTIHASDVLDFHEIYVPASLNGQTLVMSLKNLSGDADLGIAIYDFMPAYNTKLGFIVNANSNGAGMYEESGPFSLEGDQYYGLAVYKSGSPDLGKSNTYEIHFSKRGLVDVDGPAPTALELAGGFPNPFMGRTTVHYAVPAAGDRVSLGIYGIDGRLVKTLVDGAPGAGRFTATWDGTDTGGRGVAAGIYFVRLEAGGKLLKSKITHLR